MVSIFARTLIIYLLLTFCLKVMGKREIGELNVSELVSTLLISEIAAIPIDDPDIPLLNAIIPILFILSLEIIISSAKNKSNKLKKCIEGEATFIIFRGQLIQKSLYENRISINELLSEMRSQGIGNIKALNYALMEQSGKISLLKSDKEYPIAHPIIIDGELNESTITFLGYTNSDIYELVNQRCLSIGQIFLMTIDDDNYIQIIMKENL